jgi:hypothetical protein
MSALAHDEAFEGRVTACCVEQAQIFQNDGRADIAALAHTIIAESSNARGVFVLVCSSPNFRDVTDQSTAPDADILAAVQAAWPTYAGALYPQPPASG